MVPIDKSWNYLNEIFNYMKYKEDETWKFPRIYEMTVKIMNYQMLKHVYNAMTTQGIEHWITNSFMNWEELGM